MSAALLQLFRTLAAFAPRRTDLTGAPWEAYVDWAIANGLAPLAAYSLEYRLGQVGAPAWAKDRLMAVYQGTANDNVMKLVGFKGAVDGLVGRRVVLMGAASFAESLYPHVAFRPVIELELLVASRDAEPCAGYLRRAEYQPSTDAAEATAERGAGFAVGRGAGVTVLSDGRTQLSLHGGLTFDSAEDEGLLRRALPMKVFGPSMYRLDLEDAVLAVVLKLSRAGFQRPLIELVDLRELVTGATAVGGVYSRPLDVEALHRRAAVWKAQRPLWAALTLVARLFPESQGAVASALPPLAAPVRQLLERLVVTPLADLGRTERFRGEDTVLRALAGA